MTQALALSRGRTAAAAGQGADARRLLIAFIALTVWTALAILPFYRLDGADDAFYVEVAHLWTQGVPPYVGAYDVKPPGFFAILALAETFLGAGLATLRIVEVAAIALAATALFRLADARLGRVAGVLCAALYPILLIIFGDAAYAPLCALTTFAFLVALSPMALLKKAALAGVAIGAACAIKQTAACEAIVLLTVVARQSASGRRALQAAALFLVGASLAPLGFLIYYAWRGDLGVFVSDVVVFALQRPESPSDAISFWRGFARLAFFQMPMLPVTLAVGAALCQWRRLAGRLPIATISLWLLATILANLAQHSISGYYLAPSLAPALLLAAAGLTASAEGRGRIYAWGTPALFFALALFVAAALRGAFIVEDMQRKDDRALLAAQAAIAATHPRPDDRLFAINRGGWLNVTTDLAPPTPYFHWFHTLCNFPGAGASRLAEALTTRPRYIVVADRTKHYPCEQASHWRIVDDALGSAYRLADRADGDFDVYRIYERN